MESFEELSKIAKAGEIGARPLPRIIANMPREKAAAAVRAFVLLTVAIMAHFQEPAPAESITWVFAVGVIYVLVTTFLPQLKAHTPRLAVVLSIVDIGFITALIYATGGTKSEYYVLYYLPILNAAMRLNFRDAIGASVLAAVSYLFAGVSGVPEGEAAPNLLARVFVFGMSSILLAGVFAYMSRESRAYKHLSQVYRQANEEKAQFVSVASHELRTPLTAIMGFSDLLCYTDIDEEKEQEYLKIIKDQTDRLARLIENILEMSRIEAGRIKLARAAVKMEEAIARAAQKVGPNGNLRIDVPGDLPMAYADAERAEQILRIVLENAVGYCPQGPIEIRAWPETGTNGAGGRLCVEVKDRGPGIAEGDLAHIFESFYCVTTPHEHKGTGLSLAIAKRMARLLGGDLSAHSVAGEGATFWLRLPLWEEKEEPQESPAAQRRPVAETAEVAEAKTCV